jgi:excisionase family DNA binding protein
METIIITSETEIKRLIQQVVRDVIREELAARTAGSPPWAPAHEEPLVSRKEIAAYLKISLVTLHDWMNKGLPHIRHGGRILFLKSEVLEAVKDRPAKRR